MLYERWREIAAQRRNELALRELATGRSWTFSELNGLSEVAAPEEGPVMFPQGISPDFLVTVLRAWRWERAVCPLDTNQSRPRFEALPPSCVHLKTTSGTTGAARAITFTAGQLAADADNIVATMGLRPDWPNLGLISLSHSYGFSNLVLPLLLHGIPLFLLDTPLPEALRRLDAGYGPLTLASVPALWRAWHEAKAIPPNVPLAISAGAHLPLALEAEIFDATGIKVHNFYGASECGGIAFDRTSLPRSDTSVVGSPLENVKLAVDETGCLLVRGPAVGETYWPEPAPALGNGVYRTSDLAELRDSLVHLRGRAGDLINVAGRKVRPETIEQALHKHPLVSDCLAFGIPSTGAERMEDIVVCIVPKSKVTVETLREFLVSELPAWQVPREWELVESLNADQRGKLSRAGWRQWFLNRKRS